MLENYHMKVKSQLMNSNDYYVNLRLSSHVIVHWNERQIDLALIGIFDINDTIYINIEMSPS